MKALIKKLLNRLLDWDNKMVAISVLPYVKEICLDAGVDFITLEALHRLVKINTRVELSEVQLAYVLKALNSNLGDYTYAEITHNKIILHRC